MLTRDHRNVLSALNYASNGQAPLSESQLCEQSKVRSTRKIRAICADLLRQGYLSDLKTSSTGEITKAVLSYNGMIYKAIIRKEVLRYIADKWIDFFALLVSVIALVISLLALLLP